MHAKVTNSNPTNYIFLRSAINTLSIEHIKSLFFQNLKIGLECLFMASPGCFMEDIELGSHLSIKAKYFWPEGDCFRQVSLYIFLSEN